MTPWNEKIALKLFQDMYRIRAMELEIAKRYKEQKMRCPVHLSVGQEAVSAGVCANLNRSDLAVSGHRAHAHYIAKGGSLPKMMAEIYGKATGCSSGKGGSMHLIDLDAGFKGSTAIVGGTIPVGVGLSLAQKVKKQSEMTCVFLGDGAVEEGAFYEAANFAALKNLPVLFLCENNFYSVYSPLRVRQPEGRKIHELVAGMGIKTDFGDGNQIREVFEKSERAVEWIRAGKGPYFLEFETYRWLEHCGPNDDSDLPYRTEEEIQSWKARDPMALAAQEIERERWGTPEKLNELKQEVDQQVEAAFEFAEESPFPAESELREHIFSAPCGSDLGGGVTWQ